MKATATWYDYYASALDTHDDVFRTVSRTADARIVREPLGVVVAIHAVQRRTLRSAPGSWRRRLPWAMR
jgi:acyl-CoA reductase-like NAD-dependent aldehyde dehydrogenase